MHFKLKAYAISVQEKGIYNNIMLRNCDSKYVIEKLSL